MIEPIDEKTCEYFDNGLPYSTQGMIILLTSKVRELIEVVNELQKIREVTKE